MAGAVFPTVRFAVAKEPLMIAAVPPLATNVPGEVNGPGEGQSAIARLRHGARCGGCQSTIQLQASGAGQAERKPVATTQERDCRSWSSAGVLVYPALACRAEGEAAAGQT